MKKECENEDDEEEKNKQLNISAYKEMNTTYYPFIQKLIPIFNLSKHADL